eukprot:5159770-Alexandrium_andersonii.AAC.1
MSASLVGSEMCIRDRRSAFQANAGCGHLAIRPGVPTRHRHFKIGIAGGSRGPESDTEGPTYQSDVP